MLLFLVQKTTILFFTKKAFSTYNSSFFTKSDQIMLSDCSQYPSQNKNDRNGIYCVIFFRKIFLDFEKEQIATTEKKILARKFKTSLIREAIHTNRK